MDRIQRISRGHIVYRERCCRVSYGMICRELYNEAKHLGEDVTYDPRDGRKWAINQIDWFVIQVSKRKAIQRVCHAHFAGSRAGQSPVTAFASRIR